MLDGGEFWGLGQVLEQELEWIHSSFADESIGSTHRNSLSYQDVKVEWCSNGGTIQGMLLNYPF